jgi:CDP-paratose synthetase
MKNSFDFFVTGGTGFLGSSIVSELLNRKFKIVCLVRQKINLKRLAKFKDQIEIVELKSLDFEEFFQKNSVRVIIHCATNYGRSENNPIETIEANLMLPLKILFSAAKNDVEVFINTDTILDKRINYYSLSKSQFSDWFKNYANNMKCFNVALEHFYGPGDDPSKFVTWIIKEFLTNVDHIDLTLGEQRRDFIYIDDVVSAFMAIIDNENKFKKGFHQFEVGANKLIEIRELVNTIKKICNNKVTSLNFGRLSYRDGEIMESIVDLSQLKNLGWKSKVSLDQGLENTIAAYKNNPYDFKNL